MIRAIIVTLAAAADKHRARTLLLLDTISHVDELNEADTGAKAVIWRKVGSPTAIRVTQSLDEIATAINGGTPR